MEHWTRWLPVALMASRGDVAETVERQEPVQFTTHEKRGSAHPDGKGPEPRRITHTWRIITFDLSVKQERRPATARLEHDIQHPTWLALAIANETVLYVPKHIEECQRTFHHARYVNTRGKTITVTDFDKRIPQSVDQFRRTFSQVGVLHKRSARPREEQDIGIARGYAYPQEHILVLEGAGASPPGSRSARPWSSSGAQLRTCCGIWIPTRPGSSRPGTIRSGAMTPSRSCSRKTSGSPWEKRARSERCGDLPVISR